MAPVGDLVHLEVSCDPHAPRKLRKALRAAHDGQWPLEDALLVTSELVTNAVLHSGCADTDRLEVRVSRRNENLVISVHDPGLSKDAAAPVVTERFSPGGLGLALVEQLSVRWGTERPDGYRVWAELPGSPA
jgi:anti-sigma regulatory factor (Ser/Thr protein kinase)